MDHLQRGGRQGLFLFLGPGVGEDDDDDAEDEDEGGEGECVGRRDISVKEEHHGSEDEQQAADEAPEALDVVLRLFFL